MRDFLRRWLDPGRSSRDLVRSLDEFASAIRHLEAVQRKQARQLKRLRASQAEMNGRWRAAIDRHLESALENQRRERQETARAHEKLQARSLARLRAAQDHQKTERKWRALFSRQMDAVIRRLALRDIPLPPPYDVTARRFRLRSQNEEDGIILALLEHAGWTERRFVEIGSGRSGGNAALLAYECGWSGLMIDMQPEAITKIRRRFRHNPGVLAVAACVSPGNVNAILGEHGFRGEVDLLSIDIDSYDYWVLEALDVCSPRLLVLEYNAAFGPHRAVTIPLGQPLSGAPKAYRGASLAALEKLARRKGYRLVACEQSGVNAFFLRADVGRDVPGISAEHAFRPSLSRLDPAHADGGNEGVFEETPGCPLVEV